MNLSDNSLYSPFFTICIPTYNSNPIVKKAIEGAINQKFNDFEILIIDDCSSDGTFQLVEMYKDNKKIRIIRNDENIGLTANWQKCIKNSRGKYISFIHHDDEVKPDLLIDAFNIINQYNNIGILVFEAENSTYFSDKGVITAEKYLNILLSLSYAPPPSETIFLNLPEIGYDMNMNYCPEMDLYMNLLRLNYDVYHSEIVNIKRNNVKSSVTSKSFFSYKPFFDNLYFLNKWYYQYYKTKKFLISILINQYKKIIERTYVGCLKGFKDSGKMRGMFFEQIRSYNYFNLSKGNFIKLKIIFLGTNILVLFKLSILYIKSTIRKF